jgi:peptidoglycan/LPS O-acetylase OafA/YrhL
MRAVHADPGNRDNNLNLLRLVAALAVMVSHAWPIVLGPGTAEPLEAATGHTLGTMAVIVFFGLSGFLITASWHRRGDALDFAGRRLRRLLPGLVTMLLICVLVLGPLVSDLGPAAYLADSGTWRFLMRNATLMPVEPVLPGVFGSNPYPAAAGSIWTLHYEALCYLGVLVAGSVGLLTRRGIVCLLAGLAGAAVAGAAGLALHPRLDSLVMLGLPFAIGAAAWFWRAALPLSLAGSALIGAAAWLTAGTAVYPVLLAAALVYGALWLGFAPCRWAQAWNRAGDYSYGVYVYAFPVQGLVQFLWVPATPGGNLALALGPVLMLAVASWHLVEKPWLASGRTSRHAGPSRRGRAALLSRGRAPGRGR